MAVKSGVEEASYHYAVIRYRPSKSQERVLPDEKLSTPDLGLLTRALIDIFRSPGEKQKQHWLDLNTQPQRKEILVYSKDGRTLLLGSMLALGEEVVSALELATKYHENQKSKVGSEQYLEHPLEVAYLLHWAQMPADVVAAGLAHDLLEDTKCTEDEIRTLLGGEVLRIVKAVSNDKTIEDWVERKQDHIRSVEAGGWKAIAVALADHIMNMRKLLRSYDVEGPAIWKKFNRGKDLKLQYENEMFAMMRRQWNVALDPLLAEYSDLLRQVEALRE